MKLHDLQPNVKLKDKKRKGRGAGSGLGKSCLLYTSRCV